MVKLALLKKRKKELNLSYDIIAERTGYSRMSIIRIFTGETSSPRIDTLQKIAEVLELPLDELTTDNEYKVTEPLVQTLTSFKQPENNQSTANLIYLKQRKKEKKMTIQEIKALMREKNITQIELSEKSNIPLQTLRKVFSGHTANPRVDTMQAIERALGIENNYQETNQYNLTADEMELIDAYRQLLPSLKECSKELIERFVNIKLDKRCKKR